MKNQLFYILVAIGVGFIVSQSEAQQTSLTLGIDRSTGNLIATDVWNSREYDSMVEDSGRAVDERGQLTDKAGPWHHRMCFILANTFELETNGTSLKGSMIIGHYALPGYTNPNEFIPYFLIETSDDAGSLGKVYYGWSPFKDPYFANSTPSRPSSLLKVEALSHEKTKAGQILWILKVDYSIELQRPVDFIPDIYIEFDIHANDMGYHTSGSQHETTAADLKRQLQQSIVTATNLAKANKPKTPATSLAQPPNRITSGTASSALPEITLSITKQDGFLLITFSPVVTNANLEQANVNSYPWAWQPAITATNYATNGWYVVPTLEPRVFRVRIDQ
jgi:hypothetical protein